MAVLRYRMLKATLQNMDLQREVLGTVYDWIPKGKEIGEISWKLREAGGKFCLKEVFGGHKSAMIYSGVFPLFAAVGP